MALNVDPARGASTSPGGRLGRRHAEARQDRWMLELEREMFPTGAKKRHAVPQQDEGTLPRREVLRPDANGPQAGTDLPERGENRQAAVAVVVPVHGNALTSARTLASRPAVEGMAAVVPATGIVSRASVSAAAAASSGHAASIQALQEVQQVGQQVRAPMATPGRFAGPLQNSPTPAGVDPNMAAHAESCAFAFVNAESVEFDKRLMHLFSGPDGMHAYIRDAELGAARMRGVAAALSTGLALEGQSLASLTVNGKRISLTIKDAASPAVDADSDVLVGNDEPAGPSPSLQSLALVRKERSE